MKPTPLLVGLLAVVANASQGLATPAHNSCVPVNSPPPFLSGPPTWTAAWANGSQVEPSLEDPRWATSSAISFQASAGADSAAATAPLHTRAVFGTDGYLYMSFVSDLSPSNTTIPRDLFVAFQRPHSETLEAVPSSSVMFQFHLSSPTVQRASALAYCSKYNPSTGNCSAVGNTATSWWTVYHDDTSTNGGTGQCGTGGQVGHRWNIWKGGTSPFTWMNNGEASMWQFGDATAPSPGGLAVSPLDANRWAVQVRFKIGKASTSTITDGIETGSTYWFEATEHDTKSIYTSVAHWPRELTSSVCISSTNPNYVIHSQIGPTVAAGAGFGCPSCSLDNYSALTLGNTADPTCDKGLRIDSAHIGTVNDPAVTNYDTAPLGHLVKGYTDSTLSTPAVNTMVAQVINDGPDMPAAVPLRARFRVADWGTTLGQDAAWADIPGQSVAGTPLQIGNAKQKALTFNWTLGTGPLGPSELCSYGLHPKNVTCAPCTCDGTVDNCASGETGTSAGAGTKCLKLHSGHECMYVEISAPNGGATFTQSSAYNNWDFGENSTFQQTAMIDPRGLPQTDGDQKIVLVVVPRNMPAQLPPQTGVTYLRSQLLTATRAVVHVDLDAVRHRPEAEIATRAKFYKRTVPDIAVVRNGRPGKVLEEDEVLEIERARSVLAPTEYGLAGRLLEATAIAHEIATRPIVPKGTEAAELTKRLVGELGAPTAAKIVPTLEIYPYYQRKGSQAWQPMAAFSVFLSHQGGMKGYGTPTLGGPGVTSLAKNVYLLTIRRQHKPAPVPVTVTSTLTEATNVHPLPPIIHHPPIDGDPHNPHVPHHPDDPVHPDPHPHPTPHPMPRPDMR